MYAQTILKSQASAMQNAFDAESERSVSMHLVRALLILIFGFLFRGRCLDTLQEGLDGVTSTNWHSTVAHEPSILDLDSQGITDAWKAPVTKCHGQTAEALVKLWRSKHSSKNVFLLIEAQGL
jgi:hypothetical protein